MISGSSRSRKFQNCIRFSTLRRLTCFGKYCRWCAYLSRHNRSSSNPLRRSCILHCCTPLRKFHFECNRADIAFLHRTCNHRRPNCSRWSSTPHCRLHRSAFCCCTLRSLRCTCKCPSNSRTLPCCTSRSRHTSVLAAPSSPIWKGNPQRQPGSCLRGICSFHSCSRSSKRSKDVCRNCSRCCCSIHQSWSLRGRYFLRQDLGRSQLRCMRCSLRCLCYKRWCNIKCHRLHLRSSQYSKEWRRVPMTSYCSRQVSRTCNIDCSN